MLFLSCSLSLYRFAPYLQRLASSLSLAAIVSTTTFTMDTKPSEAPFVAQGDEVVYPTSTALLKQGHTCCGGCCDMRRAVIIVNIINVSILAFGAAGILAASRMSSTAAVQYDDDEVQAAFGEMGNLSVGGIIGIMTVKIVLSALGIYGAYSYSALLTGIAAASFCVEVVLSLIGVNIAGVVFAACFAYPHFFFINEVNKGIMSKENYQNEIQSCCCV